MVAALDAPQQKYTVLTFCKPYGPYRPSRKTRFFSSKFCIWKIIDTVCLMIK